MRAVIVGLGGRARSWVQVCDRNAEVEIVGYVEPSAEQRDKAIEAMDLDAGLIFESIDAAAGALEADFVIDITPPVAHEAVAMSAFGNGLDVLGEKPLSDTFDAAKRIVAAAADAGRTHMITQNYRFNPTPRTAYRLLKEGVIGDPALCVVGFYMPWATRAGTHYVTMPYPLITDMGIHHFDMLRYVLDREPVRVFAQCWNEPWGWHAGDAAHIFHAEFEGGLRVIHHSCGCSVGMKSNWNGEWRIEGPEGSLTWEDDRIFVTRSHPADQAHRDEIERDAMPQAGQDLILAEFVSACREGREPECSGADNIKSLAMVFAGITSDKEGRWVDVAELLD